MKCPFCGHPEDRVIDSRAGAAGDTIRRRRECEKCERRFTTYERVEYVLPTVVKKDGRREPFDRKKIVQALSIACNKRPVSADQIEGVADAIEREVQDADSREIPSAMLGERVMARLREMDDVAYVRFASVYRSFRDISEFAAELGRLRDDHDGPPVDGAEPTTAAAAQAVAHTTTSPVGSAIPKVEAAPTPQPGRRA